jgi:alpha-L-fucosidase 2
MKPKKLDERRRNIEMMPEAYAPEPLDLQAHLARQNPQWAGEKGYVAYWGEGAPLGNGDFGAMVYGSPENLSLVLGKNDLWLRTTDRSYFPGKNFEDILGIFRRQDQKAYDQLQPSDPNWWDRYRPSTLVQGGFLRFHLAEAAAIKQMSQDLHLHEGIWTAAFEAQGFDNVWSVSPDFTLESFCSAVDEVLVFRVSRHQRPIRSFTWRLGRESHELMPAPITDTQGALSWFEQDLVTGDRYAVALLQEGLPVETTLAGRSVIGECAGAGSEAVWYVAMATTRDASDPLDLAVERVKAAARRGIDKVRIDHVAHWSDFWKRSWVTCAEPVVERSWAVSMYLAGSTLRPGKVSPGLQGMWCRENFPAWSADFHGNINIQAIYQELFGSNHLDLFEPCTSLYAGMRPQCEQDTRTYFGCDGVRYPHAGSIDGHELTEQNYLALAPSFAPSVWIARLYWWYYTHSGDQAYLKDTGYPMLRDVARFYRGILEKTGKDADGLYQVEPSIWGEHEATRLTAWGRNSSYDVAAFGAGFEQAIAASTILGIDEGERAVWQEMLDHLPPLAADAEDIWLYFPEPQPNNMRYTSGSFFHAVFPCERVSLYHGSETLQKQARATWHYCSSTGKPNAWCGGVPTAAAVMMGDTDTAWASIIAGISRNGLTGSMPSGFFQADHGTGFAFGINTSCVFSIDGKLLLFGGVPTGVDCAFHSLRAGGAVLVSAAQRGGRVRRVSIQALVEGTLCLLNPFGPEGGADRIQVKGSDGATFDFKAVSYRAPLDWPAKAGVVYEIRET